MYIEIDLDDKTAPFEQIKASIIELIATSALRVGDRLPTIRQLAGDLGVAPNTVARAFRELEADGLLRSRGRRGTIVVGTPASEPSDDAAVTLIEEAVEAARRAGLDSATILGVVSRALAGGG